jgi:hypothetical protein
MKYVRAAVGAAIVAASGPHVCQAQSPQRHNIQSDSVSVSGIPSRWYAAPPSFALENPALAGDRTRRVRAFAGAT